MKHYFLLDFENVSDAGLAGFFDLTPSDTVYLFYTQKSNRISIDFATALLERTDHAEVRFIKVASGNQALDLQLASFLGSLIAGRKEECDYWIISRDKGFACLSSFWTNQSGLARLTQAASIQDALSAGNGNHTESAQIPPAPCRGTTAHGTPGCSPSWKTRRIAAPVLWRPLPWSLRGVLL